MKYIKRSLETAFLQANQNFPVLLITGPRQTGKSTLLKKLAENSSRTYISLDDPNARNLAKSDPALFLQRIQPPLLIDEIQYAPELLPYIKMAVDTNREPSLYWLTGSQQFHLMKHVSESLAGRIAIFNLLGLSHRELQNDSEASSFLPTKTILEKRAKKSTPLLLPELYKKILRGSFPELHQQKSIDTEFFYSAYVQTYLQRDVRDLANVGNEGSFFKFLKSCAARTGHILNIQEICRDIGINHATAKQWLSILEASGIVYLLEPFYSSIHKRLIKTPKLYFLDTGLAAYLSEWRTSETLEAGASSGAFLETWVVSEIIKSYWHHGRRAPIYYYRDKDAKEVDIIIFQDDTLYPIEIKKTASPKVQDVQQFKTLFLLKKNIASGCLLNLSPNQLPLTKDIDSVPIGFL